MTEPNTASGYLIWPEPIDMRVGCHTLMAKIRRQMKTVTQDGTQMFVFFSTNLRTVRILRPRQGGCETQTFRCGSVEALEKILTGYPDRHD